MATEPGASLPKQMHDDAALEASYRFFDSAHISYEELMRPHVEMTRQDCRQQKTVLLIQDTTDADYQHHPKTTGLGPVGTGETLGYLLQTVMAVVPSTRSVRRLAHQEPFLRKPAPKGETKHQRLQRERESQVWERSVQAIGPPPEGVCWVHVGDRGSSIFPFMYLCRENHTAFLIRAAQDRCVDLLVEQAEQPVLPRSHHKEASSAPALHLFEEVLGWPAQADSTVEIRATQKHKARKARVQLAWQPLRLLPPRTQENKGWHPLVVWVIHVWEPDPPEGVEPLEWVLLSSLEGSN